MSKLNVSRRRFLTTTAAASALALPASAKAAGANERLNIGLIGTGGRCRHLMQALAKVPNTRMMALCDVYEPHLQQAQKLAAPNAATYRDYHELLRNKDVHAVLIASPDHWHVPMTIDAMAAGKDVYVEKPLTHKMEEGRRILDAQAKHRKIVQIGTQQRSMPHIIRARELVAAGRLGTVHKVHLTWNRNSDRVRRGPQNVDPKRLDWKRFLGNAPEQPFDDYRFRNWRWFWDFGNGILTDLMVHWIDVAHWILNLQTPVRAVSMGGFNTAMGVWQTPDTIQTLLTYRKNERDDPNREIQVYFEGTFCNAYRGAMITFMGSEATLYIDRGRFELIPEPRFKQKPEEMILGTGTRGRDFYERPDGELLHLQNWVDAIRNNRQPSAPIEAGVTAAAAAHLGNEAYRQNRVAVGKG
ncbi:MAG: Gfo/Idh/MocA family oxidoreductase [Gemmataceae bacterium]|nr:Gfo/Idh/MocA family oxidoreductase [Gemmataceae bacterium]